jgi:hypothetical protein
MSLPSLQPGGIKESGSNGNAGTPTTPERPW